MSGLSLWSFALALPAVLFAGVVRGFSGFGAGLILVPSLSLVFGPATAVPTVVLIEALAAAQLVPAALPHARWRTIAPLGLSAGLMIPIGGMVLASLDPTLLRRGISAVVLLFAAVLWTGWRYRSRPSLPVALGTGATSGLLTGAAGIGGPPVILLFLSGPDRAPVTRGSLICYFAITQAVALAAYVAYGLLDGRVLIASAVLAPVFLLAAWAGTRGFGRVDETWFRRVTLVFLFLVSVIGLLRGPAGAG